MGVNWSHGLMRWMPHTNAAGETFPLNHLHPFQLPLAIGERQVVIAVAFAMHCFSRAVRDDDDPGDEYRDNREVRTFCYERYALSRGLPQIVRDLPNRHCQFAKQENFVTIDTQSQAGETIRYGVFFNMKRWKEREIPVVQDPQAHLLLTVQSAYRLNPDKPTPGTGKITFSRLVELTLEGTRPRPPRR